ncbi:MAG TPA: sigma-70 family RNA polymerase sigma factor [Pirellulales bacterium]|nr:sigma-70 family RNA polymerase sigma factor [Pirellulales bacterium]
MEIDLEETVAQLTAGEPVCLETILGELGPQVALTLRGKFGHSLNDHDVDDAIAVAANRLWENRDRYDPEKSALTTWFYLLARNAAIDLLRKQRQTAVPFEASALAEAPARREPAPQTALAANRQRIAHDFLSALPDTDHSILMAFATGEPNWATSAAEALAMPPGTVRVRKLRLLRQLRERIESSEAAFQSTDSEGGMMEINAEMSPSRDELNEFLAWLDANAGDLKRAVSQLREWSERAAKAGPLTGSQVVAHLWNADAEAGTLNDQRKDSLRTQLGWAQAAEQSQEMLRMVAEGVYRRCLAAKVLPSSLARQPTKVTVARFERSLVGTTDNLLAMMPAKVAAVGHGTLAIDWKADDLGVVSWSDDEPTDAYFVPTAAAAIELYGEMPSTVSRPVANQFAKDLRRCESILPQLAIVSEASNEQRTELSWKRAGMEDVSLPAEPSADMLARARRAAVPSDAELEWWESFPEFAQRLDGAICGAIAQRQPPGEATVHADDAVDKFPMVEKLIDVLEQRLDCSRNEIVDLVIPFVEARLDSRDRGADEPAAVERLLALLDPQLDESRL